jgi:hypothetical protein
MYEERVKSTRSAFTRTQGLPMKRRPWLGCFLFAFPVFLAAPLLATQPGQDEKQPDKKDFKKGFGPGGFGPGGFGPGGFGPGFGAGPGMGQRRKLVEQFDKDGDGRLNAEERQAAREFIKKQGGGFGKGFPGGPKGGMFGFGPGGMLAKPLIEALDSDKDGKLTKAELIAGIRQFFVAADKDKKGSLDEAQLAEALNRVLPGPPGFPGGPPFGPKGDPKGEGKGDAKGGGKGGPKGDFKGELKGFPGGFVFFGPAKALAGGIVKRAAKDGKVTLDGLIAAAEAMFREQDKNKDGKLDESAVAAGITALFPQPMGGFGPGGFGKGGMDPAKPGPKVTPADVKNYPSADLYDTTILRTVFIDFDNKDWEAELADFYHTDVEVPATVTVDGKRYAEVGVHFRGNTSYFTVPPGYKRSLHLSMDFVDSKQNLRGYRSLTLLNAHQDPTYMHSVLYCNLARKYYPAPKANFVKVVINGESWGIYANQQSFNREWVRDNFKTTRGARWKVPGHPGARGGLDYIGESIADYKRHYEIRSKDDEKDWKALIELCRVLNKTPSEKLEEALAPILEIDEVLWFLALDNVTINDDGYWTRASDYNLYRDPNGKFHVIPHDTNETFQPMGFGFGGPMGGGFGKGPKDGGGKGGGYNLDPLSGLNDPRVPLRSKLLAVPSLKAKYLANVRTIADGSLDWKNLGPMVEQYRSLIEKELEIDTRKLSTIAEFRSALAGAPAEDSAASRFNLKAFANGRRSYVLNYPEIKNLTGPK